MKEEASDKFNLSIKNLKKASNLIRKINFCNVTEGHLIECINNVVSDINSLKEQFEYFYHKEKENTTPTKVIV